MHFFKTQHGNTLHGLAKCTCAHQSWYTCLKEGIYLTHNDYNPTWPKKNSLSIYKLAHYSHLSSTKFYGAMQYTNF